MQVRLIITRSALKKRDYMFDYSDGKCIRFLGDS